MLKLTNSRSRLIRESLPADDPRQRKPDTTLAESQLGWRATTPLVDGLKATIEYFDRLLSEDGTVPAYAHGAVLGQVGSGTLASIEALQNRTPPGPSGQRLKGKSSPIRVRRGYIHRFRGDTSGDEVCLSDVEGR